MNDEILTIDELAALLKVKRSAIYSLTCNRGQVRRKHPIPVFRVGKENRFRLSDIEAWIMKCTNENTEEKRRHFKQAVTEVV